MNIEPDEDVIARFQRDHPAEAEALFQEGVQAERERITNLLKLAHPATNAIVRSAIETGREATEVFGQCFTARERATNPDQPATALLRALAAPTRSSARAQTTTAQPTQPIRSGANVQQRSAE